MENTTSLVAIDPGTTRGGHPKRSRRRLPRSLREGAWVWAGLVIILAASIVADAAEQDLPVAGEPDSGATGYSVGDTGLWFGGYLNIRGRVPPGGPATLSFEDAGLLARYERSPSLEFFAEVDVEEGLTLKEGRGVNGENRQFILERLYADYAVRPKLSIRAGKFLTPFGLWNQVRRAPLTWTVERPLVTESAFPEHTTGLGLVYQTTHNSVTVDVSGYGQAQNEVARDTSDTSASDMAGARGAVSGALGTAYAGLGFSSVAFKNRDTGLWERAFGVDLSLTLHGHEVMGEVAYSRLREPGTSHELGLYVQDVVPLRGTLYGVLRFEHFESREGNTVNGELVGINWRPRPHLMIKANYQIGSHRTSELDRGFLAAVVAYF